MTAKSIVLPEADQEIADAYFWLERRSPSLGKEFIRCVDAAMATICQAPEGFAKALDDFRHYKVRRFAYTIYYEFAGGIVVVYSVFHGTQDPAALRQKLWLRRPPEIEQ